MNGYILLSRKLIESQIWQKPPLYLKVWIYLLTKAQHKPYKKLDRGQLITSIPEIIEACTWYEGFRKCQPSKDQVFNILDWMRRSEGSLVASTGATMGATMGATDSMPTGATMITTTKATQGILITIDKYREYQDPKFYGSNDGSNDGSNAKTDTGATTETLREQRTTNNINEECIKNEETDRNINTKEINKEKTEEIILQYLIDKTGRKFHYVPENLKHIRARLKTKKYTTDDFFAVVDCKVLDWSKDQKMKEYLRPSTLFGQHFDSYLVVAKEKNKKYQDIVDWSKT